ncbi:MAG: hypothetical protein ACJAZO_002431 [Myxococcota bacterium]|jgi:hypothetical protein
MGSSLHGQTVFANTSVAARAGTGSETVNGSILANTYVTMGASATVIGSVQTGAALILGASGLTLVRGPRDLIVKGLLNLSLPRWLKTQPV